uniref:Uncharacterized protein n=1 Tax=Glossina palpalis gambiensis TaxID=67801 RepID=A0A1B0BSK4_9MUSC
MPENKRSKQGFTKKNINQYLCEILPVFELISSVPNTISFHVCEAPFQENMARGDKKSNSLTPSESYILTSSEQHISGKCCFVDSSLQKNDDERIICRGNKIKKLIKYLENGVTS